MKRLPKLLRKFRATLGPLEQAQIVASTAVVVAMVTIVLTRVFSGYTLGWYDFASVITVGIFGFLIVFFTLKYGRLLEEQKQELLALNTMAEAVNRAIEIDVLLENAMAEVKRSLDIEYCWYYHIDEERLVLRAPREGSIEGRFIIPLNTRIDDPDFQWIFSQRTERSGRRFFRSADSAWPHATIRSWASTPVMMKDEFSGIILLASTKRKAFDSKRIQLMSGFANQIGVALENAALFDRLRRSEERYMDLYENSPDMYHIVGRDGIIVSCNKTEADRLGYSKDDLVGQPLLKLYPQSYHDSSRELLKQIFDERREIKDVEEQMITREGEIIDVSVNISVLYNEVGVPVFIRLVARDVTEKKKLEAKILHAQRIDSIGNLAGGVAHDFNNVLTSILGSTAIMKRKMEEGDQWYRFADIIEMAAKRGASLTRQLLTFARKGKVQFRPVLINDIIHETLHLFERSTDKTIVVRKTLTEKGSIVRGDDGQIQQAILNILINARDAMPEGGTISVSSMIEDLDAIQPGKNHNGSKQYVAVMIEDTGAGMDPETQQRIFEPFFTTKDQGKGTGLGLSVVYGVVNAHEGFITVQSEPGKGSSFTLHFPILRKEEVRGHASSHTRVVPGHERILIIDDEENVGEVIGGMLKLLGYSVTVVDNGPAAIERIKRDNHFDAVILDMNMPTMGGKETFFLLKEVSPSLKVIISTGYSNTSIESSPLENSIDGFLQKPYQLEELSKTLREVLDHRSAQHSS